MRSQLYVGMSVLKDGVALHDRFYPGQYHKVTVKLGFAGQISCLYQKLMVFNVNLIIK